MGAPSFKALESRQARVKGMLEYILRYVLDQAVMAGRLRPGDYAPVADLKSVNQHATTETAQVMAQVGGSLAMAQDRRWITMETAARMYHAVATRLGVDYDPAEGPDTPEAKGHLTEDYSRNG
jgi:hypothetical protein